jgi:endonuclease G
MKKALCVLCALCGVYPLLFPQVFPENCEIPRCAGNSGGGDHSDHEVHAYTGYSLCYRDSFEVAEWSAYALTTERLTVVTKRSDDFAPDPHIKTASARADDYRGSGFDRGHLAPAGDMRWSEKAMSESFYMSNMTPQTPALNRGVWLRLENAVRHFAEKYAAVLVVCGPVLDGEPEAFDAIGFSTRITIPRFFYKVLAAWVPDEPDSPGGSVHLETIGFIIPNDPPKGHYRDFAVTVDEVESRTGIDFFAALDDTLEDAAEAAFNTRYW